MSLDFSRMREYDEIRRKFGDPIWTYQCSFGCKPFEYSMRLTQHLMQCGCESVYWSEKHEHYSRGRCCMAPMKLIARNKGAEALDEWHAKRKDTRTAAEKAASAIEKLDGMLPSEKFIKQLQDLVGEQQNPPPEGTGDGTIGEKSWTRLRDLADRLALSRSLVDLMKVDKDYSK